MNLVFLLLRTNWDVENPAQATGTDTEIEAAFRTAYDILRTQIEAFFAYHWISFKPIPNN